MKRRDTEFSKRRSELAKVDNILRKKEAESKKSKKAGLSK